MTAISARKATAIVVKGFTATLLFSDENHKLLGYSQEA
jgi:hypothetical protein